MEPTVLTRRVHEVRDLKETMEQSLYRLCHECYQRQGPCLMSGTTLSLYSGACCIP